MATRARFSRGGRACSIRAMSVPNRWVRPSRAAALTLCVGLVALWGLLRLVVFETTVAPLTYALPLLICVWTRDRVVLWGMAATFVTMHYVKLFHLMPWICGSEPCCG